MFLERLKTSPKDLILLIITIICFLIFILINQLIFVSLAQLTPVYGVLDFEFAWTPEKVSEIFAVWGTEGINLQTAGVYWDMLYIIGYGFFIFGSILLVSRRLGEKMQTIGLYICLFPLIAGIFDLIENIQLLFMLSNPTTFSPFTPLFAAISAFVKFSFLIIGIAFFFIALTVWIIILIKKNKND